MNALNNHWELVITAASLKGNKGILVDKSMSPSRFIELFYTLPRHIDFYVVHLIRDGRANSYSHIINFNLTASQAAINWKQTNLNIERLLKIIPKDKKILVKYEDLCLNPEIIIKKICTFIDIVYDDQMLFFRNKSQCNIGGNPMKFSGVNKIVLDEKWKCKMTDDQLKTFNMISGKYNKKFGYCG